MFFDKRRNTDIAIRVPRVERAFESLFGSTNVILYCFLSNLCLSLQNIGQLRLTKKAKGKLFQDEHSGRRASVVLAELTEEFKDMREAVKMHAESYRAPGQELDRSTDTDESADPEEFMSMTQLRSLMMMRRKARDARSRLQMRPKRQMEASGQQQHSQRGPSNEVLPPTIDDNTASTLDARMGNLEAKLDRVLLKLEGR